MAVLNAMDVKSGKVVPKVGDFVNGFSYQGGNVHTPDAWKPLSGPDYLSSISPGDAAMVKMLTDGRMPVPAGFALKSPQIMRWVNMAQQYDPTFDAASAPARAATRKDFTSGNSAQNIRNLNQALGHLNGMMQAAPQIAGHSGFPLATTVNAAINWYEKGAGQPAIADYNTSRTALSNELASVFKGKGASSEAEVNKLYDQLSDSNSTEQKQAVAKRIAELLGSRIKELGDQYVQGMGTTAPGLEILNPDAAQVYKSLSKLGIDPNAGPIQTPEPANRVGQMPGSPQAAPQPQQPTQPMNPTDALLKKYGL